MNADGLYLKNVVKSQKFENAFGVVKGGKVKKGILYDLIFTETEEAFYIKVDMPDGIIVPIHKWELMEYFQVANLTFADLVEYIYQMSLGLNGGLRKIKIFYLIDLINKGIINAVKIKKANRTTEPYIFKSGQDLSQLVFAIDNKPMTHSLLLAKALNLRHSIILKEIRYYLSFIGRDYIEAKYLDAKGEMRPGYLITELGYNNFDSWVELRAPQIAEQYSDEFYSMGVMIYTAAFTESDPFFYFTKPAKLLYAA